MKHLFFPGGVWDDAVFDLAVGTDYIGQVKPGTAFDFTLRYIYKT